RKKGDNERALSLYRRYLEADPRSEHRARVEAHILALTPQAPAVPPRPLVLAPPPFRAPPAALGVEPVRPNGARPVYRRAWFWGALGGLTLAAAAAVVAWPSHRQ